MNNNIINLPKIETTIVLEIFAIKSITNKFNQMMIKEEGKIKIK